MPIFSFVLLKNGSKYIESMVKRRLNIKYFRNCVDELFCMYLPKTFVFLAHLSLWLMVSYCDRWMSVVRRASCVINNCFKCISS